MRVVFIGHPSIGYFICLDRDELTFFWLHLLLQVIVQKPKKTRVERVESRIEANSNLKNRLKRQRKREKELAAREALRKKL